MSNEPDPSLARANPPTRVPLRIEEMLAAAAMAVMILITLGNVVARYLTNYSFAFTEEYSIALMVIVTLLGASLATAADRHIRVTYLVERWPTKRRRRVETLVMAAIVVMFGLLAALGARMTWDEWRFEVTSPGLGYPQWLYTMWLPILSLVIIGRAIGRMIRLRRGER